MSEATPDAQLGGLVGAEAMGLWGCSKALSLLSVETFLGLFLVVALARLFNLASRPSAPVLCFTDSAFNRAVIALCPRLAVPYVPTLLWGRSGHIQTILYGKMGRVMAPYPRGVRRAVVVADGATVTFDIFEPLTPHPSGDITLVVCPGIANSSESVYIRTYVHYAQTRGYRLAVLNHLGALKDSRLTAPRIFTYGGTEEYSVMVDEVVQLFPASRLIAVGFSMGANIVIKYLGEGPRRQDAFVGAVSCCQGYDILEVAPYLLAWAQLRRFYTYAITRHQRGIIRRHRSVLFGSDAVRRYGTFNERRVLAATSLRDIDDHYSHRRAGFETCEEYYRWASSRHYMHEIHIPVFFLNAMDDPLVPPELHYIPKHLALSRDNVLFAVTQHGGHLGYFEHGLLIPGPVTWLDRVVVEYSDALLTTLDALRSHTGGVPDIGADIGDLTEEIGGVYDKNGACLEETVETWITEGAEGGVEVVGKVRDFTKVNGDVQVVGNGEVEMLEVENVPEVEEISEMQVTK